MTDDATVLVFTKAALDPLRLVVLGRAVTGAVSIQAIAAEVGAPPREVAEAVGYLRAAGLLDADGALATDALRDVARQLPKEHEHLGEPVTGPWTPEEALILGRFFDGERLVRIPSSGAKRRLVLEKVAQTFEPGRRYDERDVNFLVQLIHPDYAAVRRYLVEEGFMDRADGAYWRTGGRYETDTHAAGDAQVRIATAIDDIELRSYAVGMVPALVAAANDVRIPRFMGDQFPHPYTTKDAEAWIQMASASAPTTQFAIFRGEELIGGCGGFPMRGEGTGTCEIGWWLNPDHWGVGITSAAVTALVDHLFADHGMMRLWAPVMGPNLASAGVARRAGLTLEGTSPSHYLKGGVRYDQVHYGITRSQWRSLRG